MRRGAIPWVNGTRNILAKRSAEPGRQVLDAQELNVRCLFQATCKNTMICCKPAQERMPPDQGSSKGSFPAPYW